MRKIVRDKVMCVCVTKSYLREMDSLASVDVNKCHACHAK